MDGLDFRPVERTLAPDAVAMIADLLARPSGQEVTASGTLNHAFATTIAGRAILGASLIDPDTARWVVVAGPCRDRIARLIRDGQALTVTGRYVDGDDRLIEITDFVDPI